MAKEIISEKEGISITFFFIGVSSIFPIGDSAGKDIWIAILLGITFGLLISLVYSKILSSFPGRNLFDILEFLFGKVVGKTISLLYVWFAFHLTLNCFTDFFYFIKTVTFPEIQPLITMIFPIILCIWGVKLGIEGIGRISNLALTPVILLIILLVFLVTPKMKIDHLLPVLENGFQPIFKGAFMVFSFTFAQSVVFMGFFDCFKDTKTITKVYLKGICLGGIALLIIKISDVAVLGIYTFSQYYYPTYASVSRVQMGDFIHGIEIVVGVTFVFSALIKACVSMLTVCKGLSSILSFDDYRFLATPMVLLNAASVFIINKNIMQYTAFNSHALRYYAFPFLVLFPIIILVFTLIKKKAQNMPTTG